MRDTQLSGSDTDGRGGGVLTWVLASSSCWKPSTSLLSSAALSWTNEQQLDMDNRSSKRPP